MRAPRHLAPVACAALAALLLSCVGGGLPATSSTDAATASSPTSVRHGGTLRVATAGDPPSLDLSLSTDTLVLLIVGHVQETLFTWTEDHQPVPLLADGHDVSDDGRIHTITLRRGVTFHDGTALTSDDVVASLERWGRTSGLGAGFSASLTSLETPDDLTVVVTLAHPYGAFRTALARGLQGATIHPRHVLEASSDAELTELIGTGPYRLASWRPGRELRLERFEGYVGPAGPATGYAGTRARHLDAIEFVPMPNEATRLAAIRAGDVHYVADVGPDQAATVPGRDGIVVDRAPADTWLNLVLNLRSDALEVRDVRRAIQLAIDHEAVLQAAVGPGAYELAPDLLPGVPQFESDAGAERYEAHDPATASQLLRASGYDGTPMRFMTALDHLPEHHAALTIAQQLEAVGVVVDLQVLDGAALAARRTDEDAWEMYLASASFRPDPVMRNLTAQANGWWEDPAKDRLLADLQTSVDPVERAELWRRVQDAFYEDVPRVKVGNITRLALRSEHLHGVGPSTLQPDFSNAWLER